MRVLWSFQHYQDHVVRHRLTPRHPCLHQGCGARFKTGIEMRRHTRKHSPLQAPCCLPGCPKLFICLWALNLHEREHYAATPVKTKPVKKTHDARVVGEQEDCAPKEAAVSAPDVTINKSSKAVEKVRGKQTMDSLSIEGDVEATPLVATTAGLAKKRLKDRYNLKDSSGAKNLSVPPDTDTSTPTTTIIDRLRQMLRKKTAKAKNLSTHKVSAALAVTTDSMRNRLSNTDDSGTTQVPRRRGRPLGSTKLNKMLKRKMIADQRAGLKDKPPVIKEETDPSRDRGTLIPSPLPPSPLEKTQTSLVSNEMNEMGNDAGQRCEKVTESSSTAELIDESKMPIEKQIENQCVNEEKYAIDGLPKPYVKTASRLSETSLPSTPTAEETPKLTHEETFKKSHVSKEPCVSIDKGTPTAPSNSRKVKKRIEATNTPESKKEKRGRPRKNTGLSKPSGKPAESETLGKVQLVAEDKEVVESHVSNMGKAKPMEGTIDSIVGSPAPSNSSKAKNKLKAVNAPEKKKVVKKGRPIKNPGLSKPSGKPATSETLDKVKPVTESHVADVKKEKPMEETPDCAIGSPSPSNVSKVKKRLKATHIPENKEVVDRVCPSTNQGGEPTKSETPAEVPPFSEDGKVEESHVADMGEEKPMEETLDCTIGSPAPSNSTKLKKKRKATNTLENKTVKVCPSKNTGLSKPSGKPGKSKTPAKVRPVTKDQQESQVGDTVKSKPMEETLDSTVESPAPSNVTKLKKIGKATNTPENKTIKTVCPSTKTGLSQPSETPAKVPESHAGDVGKAKPTEVKLNSTIGGPGYSRIVNGHVVPNKEPQRDNVSASDEAEKAKAIPAAASPAYGKRPFIRPPPTAYLDERYTNMPKRRKEVSMFSHPSLQDLRWPAEQAVAAVPPQRQRCANCFISFSSAEELQTHLSLKKCSTLFGFDSDDENNF